MEMAEKRRKEDQEFQLTLMKMHMQTMQTIASLNRTSTSSTANNLPANQTFGMTLERASAAANNLPANRPFGMAATLTGSSYLPGNQSPGMVVTRKPNESFTSAISGAIDHDLQYTNL